MTCTRSDLPAFFTLGKEGIPKRKS